MIDDFTFDSKSDVFTINALKICGAMKSANWNLDFTQLTKSAALNSKGKLVYFEV